MTHNSALVPSFPASSTSTRNRPAAEVWYSIATRMWSSTSAQRLMWAASNFWIVAP